MNEIIAINGLHKEFGKARVLQNISLTIREGEIFGLLGLNGAGKTTLMRCLLNLISLSQGKIDFKGKPLTEEDVHSYFGYLPEDFQPPLNLTAIELLQILRNTLNHPTSAEECLERMGLAKEKNKKIKAYSRGMIQRLGLALTLLKNPQVIILDEPILGLDLLGQRQAFDIIKELNTKGKTIIFSSHLFFHIEKYCNHIGILHEGVLKFSGDIEEFLNRRKCPSLEEAFLKEIGEK